MILQDILQEKRKEVAERKALVPIKKLEQSVFFDTPVVSLRKYLSRTDKQGIIAEIKRSSPSAGTLRPYIDVEELSISYMQAGASALSVLTDYTFFGGSLEDLTLVRKSNYCPVLRKDFLIDEYQLVEARSAGADVVLLIAAALDECCLYELARFAHELGMETLIEVHAAEELEKALAAEPSILGVNNRDLKVMKTDIQQSVKLAELIPEGTFCISESGITSAETIRTLRAAGYQGFLIGEHFMRSPEPAQACAALVRELRG